MGLLVRSVQYLHTPTLEVETSDGIKYILESGEDGSLVIKSDHKMFAEMGKPFEVVVRQMRNDDEDERWKGIKVIHPYEDSR